MSILKLFSLILGSALFFPVSCTTALFVGIEINSYLFARDMSRGDKPYNPFYVLATVPTENISPIEFLEVGEYIQKTPEVSFLLAQPSGALPGKSFSWRVISSNSYEQLVEVQYKDGDTGFINRYRAMRHLVSPVSSRMWYHGYMFVSLPFAIGFGLLVYWLGRYLRRKYVVRISERVKKWVTALVIICILGFVAIPQYVAYRKSRIKQDQATLDFNKTLKINPRDAKAYFNRGNAYDDKGQYDQAISDFNKVLEIDPKFVNAYFNRGNAYANKGQYDQAISDYTKALEIDPRDADAYFNRGRAYEEKKQYDQAISDYNKVLEINPRDADAYSNRGNAYANKGQYDQAISDYTKALEIDPRGADTYRNRGLTYAKKGQYNLAISDYTKALEINPMYTRVYINRGEAYYLEREYEKSWKDVEKAKYLGYPIDPEFLDDLRKASGRKN